MNSIFFGKELPKLGNNFKNVLKNHWISKHGSGR
jgi:hypothetical protein